MISACSQPPLYSDSVASTLWSVEADGSFPPPSSAVHFKFTSSTGLFRDLNYAPCRVPSVQINGSGGQAGVDLTAPLITFHNLNYTIRTRKKGSIFKRTDRALLNDVSGMFSKGMNAIMGPTGCGKTTLLDILAARKDNKYLKGSIQVDGEKQPNGFNVVAGYVTQDDQVMGTLTVRENLMFAAHTRLPSSVKEREKRARVEKLIEDLGLVKCANTKIGTEFIRGVSGGERKRTCIGMELLVSRGVLFLDEPTTGLDAFTAKSVMSLLKRLSSSGMTIIFSIHQPRYNIFKLFDTLMLLAAGHVIYHGEASGALDFFQEQEFKCDAHNNPPDFFLDIINGDVSYHSYVTSSVSSYKTPQEVITGLGYSLEDLKKGSIVPALAKKFRESHFNRSWHQRTEASIQSVKQKNGDGSKQPILLHSTSFLSQLYYVSKRSILNIVRNPAGLIAQLVMMLVFAIIIGILYFDLTEKGSDALQNRTGCFYVIILVQMFGNLGAIELFIKERSLFLHECRSGYYRVSAFFFSKMFCDLIPQRVIPLVFFCIITYFMIGLKREVVSFFIFFFVVFLTTLCSAMMTILISACTRVFAIANVLCGLVIMLMMLFGGLLLNVKSIASWIRWMQYLSIVRYSYKSLLINEIKDAHYGNSNCIANSTIAGNAFLESQDIAYQATWDLWQNMMSLGIGTIFLALLCYIRIRISV